MLRIEMDHRDGVCVLQFQGRMTAGIDLTYLHERAEVAKREASGGMVADLSGVAAIGSTGIGVLVSLFTSAKHAGGKFVMAAPQERVRAVLDFTRVSTIIPILASVPEAIAECRDRSEASGAR